MRSSDLGAFGESDAVHCQVHLNSGNPNTSANQVLAVIKKYGWLCGVPLAVELPALMNGLAGICYGLLRVAAPDRVPSLLALSPAAQIPAPLSLQNCRY
jgi:lanthionine synthetase-like protein